MKQREEKVRQWFSMWLEQRDRGIETLFTPDAVYVESWGPVYAGADKIRHWFEEWNTRGAVVAWDIHQFFHKEDQTVVQWFFRNEMRDGTVETFDGLTLIRWKGERIAFLQEFGCNLNRYDPYAQGETPMFQDQQTMWF